MFKSVLAFAAAASLSTAAFGATFTKTATFDGGTTEGWTTTDDGGNIKAANFINDRLELTVTNNVGSSHGYVADPNVGTIDPNTTSLSFTGTIAGANSNDNRWVMGAGWFNDNSEGLGVVTWPFAPFGGFDQYWAMFLDSDGDKVPGVAFPGDTGAPNSSAAFTGGLPGGSHDVSFTWDHTTGIATATVGALGTTTNDYSASLGSLPTFDKFGIGLFAANNPNAFINTFQTIDDVTYTAVPEPGTVSLMALLGGLLTLTRSRRRRS